MNITEDVTIDHEHNMADAKPIIPLKSQQCESTSRGEELHDVKESYEMPLEISNRNEGSKHQEDNAFSHIKTVISKDVIPTKVGSACSFESIKTRTDTEYESLMNESEPLKLPQDEQMQYEMMFPMEENLGMRVEVNAAFMSTTSAGPKDVQNHQKLNPIVQSTGHTEGGFGLTVIERNNQETEGMMRRTKDLAHQKDANLKEEQSEGNTANQIQGNQENNGRAMNVIRMSDGGSGQEKDRHHEEHSNTEGDESQRQSANGEGLHVDADAELQDMTPLIDTSMLLDKCTETQPYLDRPHGQSMAEAVDLTNEKEISVGLHAQVNPPIINQKNDLENVTKKTDELQAGTATSLQSQTLLESSSGAKELKKFSSQAWLHMHTKDTEAHIDKSSKHSTDDPLMNNSELSTLSHDEQMQYAMMLSMEESIGQSAETTVTMSKGTRDAHCHQNSDPTTRSINSSEEGFSTINLHTDSGRRPSMVTDNLQDIGLQGDIHLNQPQSEGKTIKKTQPTQEDNKRESKGILLSDLDDCSVHKEDTYQDSVEEKDTHRKTSDNRSNIQELDVDSSQGESALQIPVTPESRKLKDQALVKGNATHLNEWAERIREGNESSSTAEKLIDAQGCLIQEPAVTMDADHGTNPERHEKIAEEIGNQSEVNDSGFETSNFADFSITRNSNIESQDQEQTSDDECLDIEHLMEEFGLQEKSQPCSEGEHASARAEKDKSDLNTSYLSEDDLSKLSETEQIEYAMMLSAQEGSGKDAAESMEVVPYCPPTASGGDGNDEELPPEALRVMYELATETDPFGQLRKVAELASIAKDLQLLGMEGNNEEPQPQDVMLPTIYYLDLSVMTPEDQIEYAMYKSLPVCSSQQQTTPSLPFEEEQSPQVRVREVLSTAEVSKMTDDEQLEYALKISSPPKGDATTIDKECHQKEKEEEEGNSLNLTSGPSSTVMNITQSDVLKNVKPQELDQPDTRGS